MDSAQARKPAAGELQYFGQMGASLSHEIKNSLAIINENAGLISDLLAMGEERLVLNAGRFGTILERISKQVTRADDIVKRMNAFSHSIDIPEQQIDLYEALTLSVSLGARIAANKGICITPVKPEIPVHVSGAFYALLHLLWVIMENAMESMEQGTVMEITPLEINGTPCLLFYSAAGVADEGCRQRLESIEGQMLLSKLSARAEIEKKGEQIKLTFQG